MYYYYVGGKTMEKSTVIEEYYEKVFKITMILMNGGCLCACFVFMLLKILGYYPTVSWLPIIIFLVMDSIYLVIAFVFIKIGFVDGRLRPEILKRGKAFFIFIIIVQWNYFSYVFPTREIWGYLFFFLFFVILYFDIKLVGIAVGGLALSILVSYIIRGDILLPVKDELFVPDTALRILGMFLTMAAVFFLTYLAGVFLVNAKKDELERNNNRVQNVLDKVAGLTEKLSTASSSLLMTSQNESASTEELSAISENLLANSNVIIEKASQSKSNLNELGQSSQDIADKMQEVNEISKDLVDISASNETALMNLMNINDKVNDSTRSTRLVTDNLLQDIAEIGATLEIVSSLAASTNLLALNASIEAARAGEAGRGFTVVAQEVGKLANSTTSSLKNVNEVVDKIQNSAREVAQSMNDNYSKFVEQNTVMRDTVSEVRTMIDLLKKSTQKIKDTDTIQQKHRNVIMQTVSINEDITRCIVDENSQFADITDMVQANTEEIAEMAHQVDVLNGMVTELENMLNY